MRFRHKRNAVLFAGLFIIFYSMLSIFMNFHVFFQNLNFHNFERREFENSDSLSRTTTCSTEKHNFVFIKCMKCATETMATILRRFGYVRNLNFAIPVKTNLYFGWPFPITKEDVRPSIHDHDILMEHSIYNRTIMGQIMPNKTIYVSIIRNPWSQFKSTYNYFDIGRIAEIPNKTITEYLKNIEQYEEVYTSSGKNGDRWCIPDGFSMTKNLMSHCLGMPLGFPEGRGDISADKTAVANYIAALDREFELIMIADYFLESLVLLKRIMCWDFKDIIYHQVNVGHYNHKYWKPEGGLYEIHKNWSNVDYVLFDHFNATFWRKVHAQGQGFHDEVQHFQLIQMVVERFCFVENKWNFPNEFVTIPESKFGMEFNVTGSDCSLMNTYMLPLLWAQYFKQEGLEPEHYPEVKDRPKPQKGCSINMN